MPLQKSLKKAGETLREAAADLLPPMRVELLSDREAVVDGCKGVLEYEECLIRLNIGDGQVKFTGQKLLIRSLSANQAQIEGCIESITFLP